MNGYDGRKALYDAMLPILQAEMGTQLITQKKRLGFDGRDCPAIRSRVSLFPVLKKTA
ncbi:hypothetical protein [Siphonobacter curvatus]|uniref:hypothetical protein n=1 Tax=Siphonobacter curvatus TaxID=2094562 RepID=UPI003743778D